MHIIVVCNLKHSGYDIMEATELKTKIVQHGEKLALAGAGLLATVAGAAAMDAQDITNGTAMINAGITVAQTEPLGTIISGIAVGVGALIFIKVVRRLY